GRHPKEAGGQYRLTKETEEGIVLIIGELVNWRVPLRMLDLQMLVQSYLDRCDVDDEVFNDNTPSEDWVRRFIARHKLTVRYADNVKPDRCIMADEVLEFYDHLKEEIGDVPPENIFNFDETNFQDNPSKRK
uniref:HTH CENPB-type domain-containing protein n=1 Tax=Clytia hemisphaerica TaxID=252671 RepID=A0A7M5VFA7_9CNID